MKLVSQVFGVLLFLFSCTVDAYSPILDDLEEFDPKDIDKMLSYEPRRATRNLEALLFEYNIREEEDQPYRFALGRELLKHPGLEDSITRMFEETPRHYSELVDFRWIWYPLQQLRAPWVVELLARELMDDTPVTEPGYSPEELKASLMAGRWGHADFRRNAAIALTAMDLPYAPFEEGSRKSHLIDNHIDEWQTWWVEHGDEVIAQLEAEQAAREKAENKAIAAAKAKAERLKNHPRNPPAPSASEDGTQTQQKSPSYRWVRFAVFVLLILAIAAFALTHLQKRRQ